MTIMKLTRIAARHKKPAEHSMVKTARGFMDLVQKYLEQPLSIYKTIQTESCSRVSFENLWMLFNRDETIYCPGKRARQELILRLAGKMTKTYTGNTDWPQAFRVYKCHGGLGIGPAPMSQFHDSIHTPQSHQNATQDQSYEGPRESSTQPVVYCFTVRFNRQKYGPTTDFFIFKPFDGEIDITDLEAYPGGFVIPPNQTLEVAIGKPCEHRFPWYRWACMYDAYVEARGVADLSAYALRNRKWCMAAPTPFTYSILSTNHTDGASRSGRGEC
ncbi:hypothetical protein F5X96DRAFT_641228 [Biscogniauxia mediterranea]|nr:hypothetical protein F5X96DRAFT_641228 [Biscogniauxia mediterranea]